MARTYFLSIPTLLVVTLTLAACGKFASDPAASRLSAAANPLQAEREDAVIKLAAPKDVPSDVAALFSKERKQSDASLANPYLLAGSNDPRLMASVSSLNRLNAVLLKRRTEMLRVLDLMTKGRALSSDERAWILALSNEFKAKAGNIDDLKQRVDVWPSGFILGSVLVLGKSWPTENELSDRLTVLNTSNKAELISVRALRSRLSSETSKSDLEKSRALVEELTKSLPTVKVEMLKTVSDISTALEGRVLGVKP